MKERVQELKADTANGKAPCSRRSPDAEPIAPWASGCMRSSRPTRQPLRRNSGTGCPPMPRTARSSAFSERAEIQDEVRDVWLQHAANLDAGALWPVAFALQELTAAAEAQIGALVKKAVSPG